MQITSSSQLKRLTFIFLKPVRITSEFQAIRDAFDLDRCIALLPPPNDPCGLAGNSRGQAGLRLRPNHLADISDALLREFAKDTLGANRCNGQYLDALRVVLGNQGHAERHDYTLELNQRVPFATPRTMRTIIDQMWGAGKTKGVKVSLGSGRCQTVQTYPPEVEDDIETTVDDMYRWDRAREESDPRLLLGATLLDSWEHVTIQAIDIPH